MSASRHFFAIAFSSAGPARVVTAALVATAALATVGCRNTLSPPLQGVATAPAPAAKEGASGEMSAGSDASSQSSYAHPDAALALDSDAAAEDVRSAADDPYLFAAPVSTKSIGHTSYVLKVHLTGGKAAAFKPRSRRPLGDRRYKGEIAAYRLARALGLVNVPRAEPRVFAADALRRSFSTPEGAAAFERWALPDEHGELRGAIIPWIDDYEEVPLEQTAWRAKWTGWLTDELAPVPESDRPLAAAISTMLVFDYVTANWDRWSGGNVAESRGSGTLLFVDNDGAFYERPAPEPLARQLALVKRLVRYSRPFVEALRAFDENRLGAVFGDETPGQPLLPPEVVDAAAKRMRAAVSVVEARINRAGETATLCLP